MNQEPLGGFVASLVEIGLSVLQLGEMPCYTHRQTGIDRAEAVFEKGCVGIVAVDMLDETLAAGCEIFGARDSVRYRLAYSLRA